MFCPKCGKEIKDGSKFCKHCGAKIKPKNDNANATATNAKSTTTNAKTTTTTASSDDSTKKIIIGVLIAAIVILAVVFVGFGTGLFNGNSNTADGNAQVQQANSQPSKSVSLSSFPVSEAPALAQAIKSSGGSFPVQFQSLSLSKAQCLYILTKSISQIGTGHPDASISVGDLSYAAHPSGRDSSQSIARDNYVDMTNRFSSWIDKTGTVPNYVGVYTGGADDISPTKMMDICIAILLEYGNTHNLPASVKV